MTSAEFRKAVRERCEHGKKTAPRLECAVLYDDRPCTREKCAGCPNLREVTP